MSNFHTTWPLFLTILFGYLALSLVIGGKGVFFEPFKGEEEKKENAPTDVV